MYDVAVVMPVYNEAQCIEKVIAAWLSVLGGLDLNFCLLVINDGSTDATPEILNRLGHSPAVKIVHKKNSGHGPTILQGYRMAADEASWVFQVDGDDEMDARSFKNLWDARSGCDAVIAVRGGRRQPLMRRIISLVSRAVVRAGYGPGVTDVNCPFRLINAAVLRRVLDQIPPDTFAPNVAMSGLLVLHKKKVRNIAVPHRERRTGTVSIRKGKLIKAAVRSLGQTVMIRLRV